MNGHAWACKACSRFGCCNVHHAVKYPTARRTSGATNVTVGKATGQVKAQLRSQCATKSGDTPCVMTMTKAEEDRDRYFRIHIKMYTLALTPSRPDFYNLMNHLRAFSWS